jgi:uncharacterized membrane protein YeiB
MLLMFIAHYGATVDDGASQTPWASSVVRFTDGRAMPLFVMLSGAGFALLARRPPVAARVVPRAALLLVAGLWLDGGLVAPILQYYSLYLLAGLLVIRIESRWWLPLAGVVTATGALVALHWIDHLPDPYRITSDSGWAAMGALRHPWRLFSTLAFTGTYPLFPSFAFFLVGMWVARQNLRSSRFQLMVLLVGAAIAVCGYGLGWRTDSHRLALDPPSTSAWRLLSAAGHSNMPVWVVAATGFALAVLGGASWLAPHLGFVSRALARTGRLALTFYVVHVWLLRRGLRHWPWDLSNEMILLAIAALFVGVVVVADRWLSRFAYGPLEAALRAPDLMLGAGGRSR